MNKNVREWCRNECIRQHATTDEDFAGMEEAWEYAKVVSDTITHVPLNVFVIRRLAGYIDPIANKVGTDSAYSELGCFRTGPAVFMNGGTSAPANEIEYRLNNLINWMGNGFALTPNEFYQTLMWIHPLRDGNGRLGALVYNILNGTINNPVVSPEYR